MATVTIHARGDQIGTYASLSGKGNGAQRVVSLEGVQAIGTPDQIYTITVTQVAPGETQFRNGQFVTITAPDGKVIVEKLLVQPDIEQGRGAGDEHLIFEQQKFLIDLNGLPATPSKMIYNPSSDIANPNRGDNDGELDFADFVCFTPGTLILTPAGEVPVEALAPGDRVVTDGGGSAEIRWTGRRTVPGAGRHAPVLIAAGTLGNRRDLMVSPQHRMVVADWRAELLFGLAECLVPAVALVDGERIRRHPLPEVTYLHFLCEGHAIVRAEGARTESFHPGRWSLGALGGETREEILALFPELAVPGLLDRLPPALPALPVREGRLLARAMRE